MDLYTHESMTENIGLYEYLGYIETDRRTDKSYRRVYMRKNLASGLDQAEQRMGITEKSSAWVSEARAILLQI